MRGGVGAAVGHADEDLSDPSRDRLVVGWTAQLHLGATAVADAHLHGCPGDPRAAPQPEGPQDGLLGGPAGGEVLDRTEARLAFPLFELGEDPGEERLAVLFQEAANADALDDLRADPKNVQGASLRSGRGVSADDSV